MATRDPNDRGSKDPGRSGGSTRTATGHQAAITQGSTGQNKVAAPGHAPVHTSQDGLSKGITVQATDKKWAGTQKRVKDINAAQAEYENRGFLDRVIDFVSGPLYDAQAPNIDDPRTYYDGKYHTSTDVLGTAGMVGGLVAGAPLVGTAIATAEDVLGLDTDVYHNPAPKDYAAKNYGMAPDAGWSEAAGGKPAHQTSSPAGKGDQSGEMQGGLLAHPSAIVTNMQGGLQSQPSNPTVPATPPTTQQPNDYPTPTERWGANGQNGSFLFDDATGQVKFLPA